MYRFILAIIVFVIFSTYVTQVDAQTTTKVVVIPLGGDEVDIEEVAAEVEDAVIDEVKNEIFLTTYYYGCVWSACVDAPSYQHCGQGYVMVGIDVPEFGGNEGSCNTNSISGPDDYRIRCCRVGVNAVP